MTPTPSIPTWRQNAPAGVTLARAATGSAGTPAGESKAIPPALYTIIRPGAQDRWLGCVARSYDPQRIEQVLRGAMNGNLVDQWNLFDLMEDTWPRLSKNLNKLKRAVKSRMRNFKPWAEEDEPPTPEAKQRAKVASSALWKMRPKRDENQNGFDDTIYDILDAWGKGVALLEVDWEVRDSGKLGPIVAPQGTRYIHPRFYGYTNAGWLGLNVHEIKSAAAAAGRPSGDITQALTVDPEGDGIYARIPPDKFLICICKARSGHPSITALLRPLAFWWSASNFTQQWFLNFAQIFGLPIRWANYDPNTPGLVDKVLDMLENMGSAAYGAFPAGTTLELKEPMKAGSDNPQISVLDRADHNCDLLILGQSGTTQISAPGQSGGSNAANKVLEGVEEDIIEAACDYTESVLNEQSLPSITRLNFGDDQYCPEVCLEAYEEEDKKGVAEMFKVASDIGVKIPSTYAHKRLDIPEPAPEEEVLEPRGVASLGLAGGPSDLSADATSARASADRATQKLIDNTLEDLTGIEARWLGNVRPFFHRLIALAQSGEVTDAEFTAALAKAADEMPELFAKLKPEALAESLENAMSSALVNGAVRGAMKRKVAA